MTKKPTKIKSAKKAKVLSVPKTSGASLKITDTNFAKLISNQKEITKPDSKTIVAINDFVNKINSALLANKINAEASLGGSVAKGTYIKDNFDADIFVKFDTKYRGQKISDILEGVLKKMKIDSSRVHGSRDYFQIKKNFTYELVPVLKVKDYREAENVADMSPLHVDYFVKKSRKIKNLRDEIRITKVFMKSARVYGAESYIKGFSGHVVDLLIIKYETFLELVKAASKWKDNVIIDIEKHHIDAKMSLNNSKTSGPLIIVDPIQKNRNAAAALSKECFDSFRQRCREFLKKGDESFFAMPNFNEIIDDKISKLKDADTFIVNIVPLDGKRDVIGSKVLKIKEYLEQETKNNDFQIKWSDWEFNEKNSRIVLSVDSKTLSAVKILQGPPIEMKDSCIQFKKSHKKTFAKDNYLFAEEKRKHIKAKSLIEFAIKNNYVLEKCKSISFVSLKK